MNNKRNQSKYWIDTTGKCHKFKGNSDDIISIHYQIAKKIYPESDNPDDVLMNLGWVMVGSSCYHCPIIHKNPTQSQINTLNDLDLFDRLCFLHNGYYENYKKYGILLSD